MADIQKPRSMIDLKTAVMMALMFVMVCTFQIMILPALAQYACGLQSGKYANYNWSISYSAAGQSYSMSGTLDINIQSVSGSSYSGTYKEAVTGGSIPTGIFTIPGTNQTFSGDVGSGYGTTGFITLLAIPANMTSGSSTPSGDTVQSGSWGGRNAIVLNSSGLSLGQGNVYYDNTTGVFLSATTTMSYLGIYSLNFKVDMVGTDLWSGGIGGGLGLSPWILAVIIVIIIVAVAAVVMIRRKRQPTVPTSLPLQPPPPPPPPASSS